MKYPTVRYTHDKHRGHIVHMDMLDLVDQDSDIDTVIEWLNNHCHKRIAYNMWKFRSTQDANECIILYNLTWT